jgi:outer membrane protein assembly factor BamB
VSLIDLGEVGHAPEPTARPPRPPRRPHRGLILGALLGLVVASMGGAAPRPAPLPEATIPARLGAFTFVEGDRLFVTEPVDSSGGGGEPTISAYRLPDVRPLWRTALPRLAGDGVTQVSPQMAGETLVLNDMSGEWPGSSAQATALDVRTGAVRWRQAGHSVGVTAGGDVLLWLRGEDSEVGSSPTGTLTAVAPESGVVRWSLPIPAGQGFTVDSESPRAARSLLTFLSMGRVEVRDLETGELRRRVDLPDPLPQQEQRWQVVGDLLVTPDERRRTLTAYGLSRLDRRWRIPLTAQDSTFASPCGDSICLWGNDAGVRVLDARDGSTRWSAPRWVNVEQVGRFFLANAVSGNVTPAAIAVLDPASGRQIGELGAWQAVGLPRADGRLLAVRTHLPTGRTQVALLDPATLTVRTLGMINKISGQCEAGPRVIICRRRDASVGVWRLPQ